MTETVQEPDAPVAEAPPEAAAPPEQAPEPVTKVPAEMFKFSAWVHVGPGAEECEAIDEQAGTNECSNPLHFHAWCRLPNQFQHKQIREKAVAAKARRMRAMRDEETDSYAILESDIDTLRRGVSKEVLVEEIVGKDWWRNFMEASKDVHEQDEFEHIERDQERWQELDGMLEDDRPKEEYEELSRHIEAYSKAVETRRKELVQPELDALNARDIDDLVDLIRGDRIAAAGQAEMMNVYSREEWYLSTLVHPPNRTAERPEQEKVQGIVGVAPRRFASIEQLTGAAPEVVEALGRTFDELENALNMGLSGNS